MTGLSRWPVRRPSRGTPPRRFPEPTTSVGWPSRQGQLPLIGKADMHALTGQAVAQNTYGRQEACGRLKSFGSRSGIQKSGLSTGPWFCAEACASAEGQVAKTTTIATRAATESQHRGTLNWIAMEIGTLIELGH